MASIGFDSGRSDERKAIVVSFDLCGFSDFCNHADAYALLPKFLSTLFDEVDSFFLHWLEAGVWQLASEGDKIRAPDFIKYTGDGALMIWLLPDDLGRRQECCTAVVRAMHKLHERVAEVIPQWEIEWQTHNLPRRARFGIATGLVHPLRSKSPTLISGPVVDYAGYCINLAVRLQNHCPEIGFIIHEPALPKLPGLIKWIAHGMKGARSEPVLMFTADMPGLTLDYINSKFLPIGEEAEARCAVTLREPHMKWGTKEAPTLIQPRFEAHFMTGTRVNCSAFIGEALSEFIFIWDNKDSSGKVVGQKKVYFRLHSKGPPLTYQFVRSEPYDKPKT